MPILAWEAYSRGLWDAKPHGRHDSTGGKGTAARLNYFALRAARKKAKNISAAPERHFLNEVDGGQWEQIAHGRVGAKT